HDRRGRVRSRALGSTGATAEQDGFSARKRTVHQSGFDAGGKEQEPNSKRARVEPGSNEPHQEGTVQRAYGSRKRAYAHRTHQSIADNTDVCDRVTPTAFSDAAHTAQNTSEKSFCRGRKLTITFLLFRVVHLSRHKHGEYDRQGECGNDHSKRNVYVDVDIH